MADEFFTCPQTGRTRNLTQERAAYVRREKAIRSAARNAKQTELHRIMARFEFESDEFYTAEEKARIYRDTGQILPRG